MPFLSDTSWPTGLLTIFDHGRAKRATFEHRYYGPYDKLLNYCFGDDDFTFYVAPQKSPPRDDGRDGVSDLLVSLVVYSTAYDKPVMIVEIKDDSWAEKAELRYRADKQMRDRYSLVLEDCVTPRLWGLSVFGTAMRVYCGDRGTFEVSPPVVARPEPSSRVLLPSFLFGEWGLDVLSQEGFDKIQEIVTDILAETGNLE